MHQRYINLSYRSSRACLYGAYRRSTRLLFSSPFLGASEVKLQSFASPSSKPLGQDNTVENNIRSETNKLAKTRQRFWKEADIFHNQDKNSYEVQLDGKTVKTPLGFPLMLPAEKKSLAYLVKHEWANLPDSRIKIHSLPLTSIAARSIDLSQANENLMDAELIAKVGRLDDIKFNLLRYLDTDTCLIFTTIDEYEGKLREKQNDLYLPLIEEFEDYFTSYAKSKGNLLPSDDHRVKLLFLDCETDGLRGNKQSITTQNIVLDWMNSLNIYELVALEKAVFSSKSFLCGATLLRSNCSDPARMLELFQVNKNSLSEHFFKSIDEIVELGNLETIYQTAEWGEVEDTHDVDKEDWLRNLSSAALLSY